MTIRCYVDGAARPNPGKGGIGVVFEGNIMSYTISEKVPGDKLTNNQVEYLAFNRGLAEILSYGFNAEEIVVYSDSELLTTQLNGEREVDKGGKYVGSYLRAKELVKHFPRLIIKWIPREENTEANLLASKAVK